MVDGVALEPEMGCGRVSVSGLSHPKVGEHGRGGSWPRGRMCEVGCPAGENDR